MIFSPTTEDFLGLASEHDERESVIHLGNIAEEDAGYNLGYGSSPMLPPKDCSEAFYLGFRQGRQHWLNDCAS